MSRSNARAESAVERSFLFTDIEGSTSRWERQPEQMRMALELHDRCIQAAVVAYGGRVYKTIGDAFQVVFDAPHDALLAAVDAQRALANADWQGMGKGFAPLMVRMALHLGIAAPDVDGDYRTPLLNRLARVEAAGRGGQLLVTKAVWERLAEELPAGVRLRDLGQHRLRDLRHVEHIAQVVAEGMPDITARLRTAESLAPRDRILIREPQKGHDDAVAGFDPREELLRAIRSNETVSTLSPAEIATLAHLPRHDLESYRLSRVAEWSQPRYRIDGRFVSMTLLIDQGDSGETERWQAQPERHEDLSELLARIDEPALVLLGAPGSGKSTLLRRMELDLSIAGLRGDSDGLSFLVALGGYAPESAGAGHPDPERWLAARWASQNPDLPSLDDLLRRGGMLLLLDGLNEIPAASEPESRAAVQRWKEWLQRHFANRPGNRVVFTCRSLDYSQPLSSPELRVPQARIEALSSAQILEFLKLHTPLHWREAWAELRDSEHLEVLRSPFFLELLTEQIDRSGAMPRGRPAIFTGFLRRALRREIERGHPLFQADGLLTARDLRQVTFDRWANEWDLPERGCLIPGLSGLAAGMQLRDGEGERGQVRLLYDDALLLAGPDRAQDVLQAGTALAALDEDPSSDEIMFVHQLVQEFFAARDLALADELKLLWAAQLASEIDPPLEVTMAELPLAEPLPPLSSTGWEETAILASAICPDPDAFLERVLEQNLSLAGRCAVDPSVRSRLGAGTCDALRSRLLERSRDVSSDLRDRISCGLSLGWLGDPRLREPSGENGSFLEAPMVRIEAYEGEMDFVEQPGAEPVRLAVEIPAFEIGRFPVTNAEWSCFMEAGGYLDPRWWQGEASEGWRSGETTNLGRRRNVRHFYELWKSQPELLDAHLSTGEVPRTEYELWQERLAMDPATFDDYVDEVLPMPLRIRSPRYWKDPRFNNPAQPVVGVCWYEARAYARWLSGRLEKRFYLPSDLEWQLAAGGSDGQRYSSERRVDPLDCNIIETHVRAPTPVGVFPGGDAPTGIADPIGSISEWVEGIGPVEGIRSGGDAPSLRKARARNREWKRRVLRSAAWNVRAEHAHVHWRNPREIDYRFVGSGFRLASSPLEGTS